MDQRALDIYDKAAVMWQDLLAELLAKCDSAEFLSRFPIHDSDPLPPDFIEYGASVSITLCHISSLSLFHKCPLSLPSYIIRSHVNHRIVSYSLLMTVLVLVLALALAP